MFAAKKVPMILARGTFKKARPAAFHLRLAFPEPAIATPAMFALAISAYGTFRTCRDVRVESAFEGKPDLTIATADFRV
jgi:hypothetical protein